MVSFLRRDDDEEEEKSCKKFVLCIIRIALVVVRLSTDLKIVFFLFSKTFLNSPSKPISSDWFFLLRFLLLLWTL